MSYIVQRNQSFYVVAYNGRDPVTGRERRRWHPAGPDRSEADAMKTRIDRTKPRGKPGGTLGAFMAGPWLDSKPTITHPTRARYVWMIDKNIASVIGHIELARLRPEDLDAFYADLLQSGGRQMQSLAAKTVLEIHRTISNALDLAVDRQLISINPAYRARPPRTKRLHPALHLTAHTGIRRGELAGLNWSDLNQSAATLSIARTQQVAAGRVVEAPVKTRNSRRSIDLDTRTIAVLTRWRKRLTREGAAITPTTPMFLNRQHNPPSPESFSQRFTRSTVDAGLPRIRFHDLRHTHASLLVAAGVPIKVVSERLGHAHPGFTMHTYQHLLPGMGAAAAQQFAELIDASR